MLSASSVSLVQLAPSSRADIDADAARDAAQVDCTVLLRPIQNVGVTDRPAQCECRARTLSRAWSSVPRYSRAEPSSAFALAMAVLMKSRSPAALTGRLQTPATRALPQIARRDSPERALTLRRSH